MLKAILFDLDGTLINSEEFYMKGMANIANRFGKGYKPSDFYSAIGKDMDVTYQIFENVLGIKKDKWLKEYHDYFCYEDPICFKDLLFDDVLETFKGIKDRNIKIAICSMSPETYIEQFVKECGLKEYVDYYISGETCKNNKPAPDIYLKALSDLKINKDEALVVEDAKEGIISGLKAGIKVVARDDSRFNIDQSGASLVFKDLRKLLTIL